MNLSGQYLRSSVSTDARYFDVAAGNFALLSSLLLYSGQFKIGTSAANAPHLLVNAGTEIRPFRRLRIIESFTTNRYSSTGEGVLTQQILITPGMSIPALVTALNSPESVNYNQQQVEGIVDVPSKITLRGGWRYAWGDATVRAGPLSQTAPPELGPLKPPLRLPEPPPRPSHTP